jgi:hypothetical protein
MVYLAIFHWGYLVGATLIGLLAGWIAVVYRGAQLSRRSMALITVVVVVLLGVSLSRIVPGRPGYWLDLGLVMFVLYLIGCAIGSALRNAVLARHMRSSG